MDITSAITSTITITIATIIMISIIPVAWRSGLPCLQWTTMVCHGQPFIKSAEAALARASSSSSRHRDVSLQAGIALRGAPGLLRVLRLLPSVFEAPEQFQMVSELAGLGSWESRCCLGCHG